MARKSIKQIRDQIKRALNSLNEGWTNTGTNKYMASQVKGYLRNNPEPGQPGEKMQKSAKYAADKYIQRGHQIINTGERMVRELREKGKAIRIARKAKGLSAG